MAMLIETNSGPAAVTKFAMIDGTVFRVSKTNHRIAFVERFPIMLQPFIAGLKRIPQAAMKTKSFRANQLSSLAIFNVFDSNKFL